MISSGTLQQLKKDLQFFYLCGNGDDDKIEKFERIVRSKLPSGYLYPKGYPGFIFFIGLDGTVGAESGSAKDQCFRQNFQPDGQKPGRAEVLLQLLMELYRRIHLNSMKKGHEERVKERQSHIYKQG